MGHAYPEKVSKHVNKLLRGAWMAQKHVTISEIIDSLIANKIKLSTAEGLYDASNDEHRPVVAHCVEQIMDEMYSRGEVDPRPKTAEQKRIWKQWKDEGAMDWDSGDDGKSGEYGVFDSIPWWPLKRRYWVIRRIEN